MENRSKWAVGSHIYDYYLVVDTKFTKIIRHFDKQILKNFQDAEIECRPVASTGLWCGMLLPLLLLFTTLGDNVNQAYRLTTYLSLALFCYSFLFALFISVSCLVLKDRAYGGCTASVFFSSLLIYTFLEADIFLAVALSTIAVVSYAAILRLMLTQCPRTFTIGEAMVVAQGTVLFTIKAAANMTVKCSKDDPQRMIVMVNCVVLTMLVTICAVIAAIFIMREKSRSIESLSIILMIAAAFELTIIRIILGPGCFAQIMEFIFGHKQRLKLIIFWATLVALAAVVLAVRTNMGSKASTGARKAFHILAALVFLSGILTDVHFMKLAAGLGFAALLFVEALRKSGIEPVSTILQSAFEVYKDEKDCGIFALTPIYLYVGLAVPLLALPSNEPGQLEMLAGVLATGVGDTAASWFGQRYGITKWPDGDRTIEGSVFNVISQILVVYILEVFELLNAPQWLLRTSVAAAAAAAVEARTRQVDNLVLPVVMMLGFTITKACRH